MVTIIFHICEEQCDHFSKQVSCYMAAVWDEEPSFMDASGMLGLYSTVTPQLGIQLCIELEIKIIIVTALEERDLCLSFTQTLCKLVGIQLMASAQSSGSAKNLE